jgi:hypothetical protein
MERTAETAASATTSGARQSAELRRLDWARALSGDALCAIEACGEFATYDAGQILVEFDAELTHVYFVLAGRLTAEINELRKLLSRLDPKLFPLPG